MKRYLFILAALAAFLVPGLAQAANRFLTCSTTCTIDASNTAIWGTASGGTGASVPTTTDDVILDAATCVGGTTCTATFGAGYNPTWISLTMSLCTATTAGCILDANPNGNTITLTSATTAYTNTGSTTRTLSGGTWVLTGNGAIWNVASGSGFTNSPSVSFTGTGTAGSTRRLTSGGKTYGTVTINSSLSSTVILAAPTITTLTVGAGNTVAFAGANTTTVTTLTNITGSSSAQTLFTSDSLFNGRPTISSANNWTCTWCGMSGVIFSGGGTFSATSSFDFLGNTGITISPPSGGGATTITVGGFGAR